MFELNMHSQYAIGAVPKKENGVRSNRFASFDPASATAVATAVVIRPEWLLGRLFPPPLRALLVEENA